VFFLHNNILGRYLQPPALRHGLNGVNRQVMQNLADLASVNLRRPKFARDIIRANDIRPAGNKINGFLDQRTDFHNLLDRGAAFGERQKLLGQLLGLHGCFFNLREQRKLLALRLHIKLRQGNIPNDRRQNIVKIMRDPPGENTDRFQFLDFIELLPDSFFRSNILQNNHYPNKIVIMVFNRRRVKNHHLQFSRRIFQAPPPALHGETTLFNLHKVRVFPGAELHVFKKENFREFFISHILLRHPAQFLRCFIYQYYPVLQVRRNHRVRD